MTAEHGSAATSSNPLGMQADTAPRSPFFFVPTLDGIMGAFVVGLLGGTSLTVALIPEPYFWTGMIHGASWGLLMVGLHLRERRRELSR